MGMTTTLPASINLAAIGNAESGTGKYIANSGSTVFNFDGAVISVALTVYGNTMAISPGFDFGTYPSAMDIDNITITAVGNGSTTLEIVSGKPSATPTVSIPVTVGAVADDESYLNKRGLAHFWENIDTLKQDKLTAGTNIAISANNTISAETGWKYLGQVKLASAGASLTFNLPAQYDNYKIIAAGEMASGSNATCQLQLLRSGSAIPSAWGVLDINGSNIVAGTRTAADDQFSMTTCNQYDTINMEMTSFKTASTQWRKYQGYQARMGSAYVTRQYNGRFNSSTEPNQVRIWTNATFGAGTVIKVWASNNT